MSLPILKVRDQLLEKVDNHQTLVVTGETGSGKSTQISQFLFRHGYRKIAVTQPRRVGAISLATRVAGEMKARLGGEVGYTVRFDDCSSPKTQIKYLTDGCLLRECLRDRRLESYNVILLDEAHERSLQTDILFGLLVELARRRSREAGARDRKNRFRLIITSATLNTEKFCAYFACKAFEIPGRAFPVEIKNSDSAPRRYSLAVVETVLGIHRKRPAGGHVLAFLTGREEVDDACALLGQKVDSLIDAGEELPDIVILPAYSTLRTSEQKKIFFSAPPNCRKVVFATNIAETSLTVPGVRYVVDSGFVKQKIFNERTGIDSLVVVPISRVAAVQRAGRAGRTCEGVCYRLYTAKDYDDMAAEARPEIVRSSLPGVLLTLKALGVANPFSFAFLDRPRPEAMADGLRTLFFLGAVSAAGRLTALGRTMARFPLDPTLAKLLVSAAAFGCEETLLSVACMLSVDNVWTHYSAQEQIRAREESRRRLGDADGDHFTLANVFEQWRRRGFSRRWAEESHLNYWNLEQARSVRRQLAEIVGIVARDGGAVERARDALSGSGGGMCIEEGDGERLRCRKILANVFFMNSCRLREGNPKGVVYVPVESYREGISGERGIYNYWMHKSCCLYDKPPGWVVYNHVIFTSKPYIQHVTRIRFEWIADLLPKLKEVDVENLCGGYSNGSGGTVAPGETRGAAVRSKRRRVEAENAREKVCSARQRFFERKKGRAAR